MKSNLSIYLLKITTIVLFATLPVLNSIAEDNGGFSARVYAKRRAKFINNLPDSSMAVFHAATLKNRSNDVEFEFRQDNNLLYFTGIEDAQTVLILLKISEIIDSTETREILFVPKPNPRLAGIVGAATTPDAASEKLKITVVKTYDEFGGICRQLLAGKKTLFYTFPINFLYENLTDQRYFITQKSKKWLKENFVGLEVKSPKKIMAQLRQIKSAEELVYLRTAINITCEAHNEAMRRAEPGLYEYQLEAAVEYVFKHRGAEYPAFPSIVGSGPNSTILHYSASRRQLQANDMVVIDIGAEYHGYSADVTRTIPASGKFSSVQKEIYEIVLHAQNQAMQIIKPGVPFREVHRVAKRAIEASGYGEYFRHGTSHYLGMDTHDIGDRGPLQAGMVITVEPGIYIKEGSTAEKKYWNIGVRIEDDVLVTADGYKLLSVTAPRTVADIEKLMKKNAKWTSKVE